MPFSPLDNDKVTPRRALNSPFPSSFVTAKPRRALKPLTSARAAKVAPSIIEIVALAAVSLAFISGDTQATLAGSNVVASPSASAVSEKTPEQTTTNALLSASRGAEPIPILAGSPPKVKQESPKKVESFEPLVAKKEVLKPAPKKVTPVHKKSSPAPRKATPRKASGSLSGARCASGSGVESGLVANAVKVHRALCSRFPGIYAYGGRRSSSGYHGTGQALDCMIRSQSYGWQVAKWVRANAKSLGVSEVIFAQHIWTRQRSSEGWRGMSDRGSATANHYDHVHVSVY